MIVGTFRVRLLIRESKSLKDKRRVVHSLKDRLRNEFNVSVSEIECQDHRQLAVLGIAMVASESCQLASTLDRIKEMLRRHPVAEILDCQREL
jgi:uncharacterized protein YlxP (DUF503 family)